MVKKISQTQITAGYYDLRQALSEVGCLLCRLLAGDADHHIDGRVAALTQYPWALQPIEQTE